MGTVDLSRVGTDFRKRYAGVRMQQGRVLSDDVFNNAECIDEEDMRRTRIDVIGPVGSPDSGFLPVVPAGPLAVPGKVQFSIAAGTLYLGGLRIEEPAADLAVAVALASSLRERPVRSGTVLAGELSLAGRLRAAGRAERRLAEARRLGFDRLITGPSRGTDGAGPNGPETAVDLRSALLSALVEG